MNILRTLVFMTIFVFVVSTIIENHEDFDKLLGNPVIFALSLQNEDKTVTSPRVLGSFVRTSAGLDLDMHYVNHPGVLTQIKDLKVINIRQLIAERIQKPGKFVKEETEISSIRVKFVKHLKTSTWEASQSEIN